MSSLIDYLWPILSDRSEEFGKWAVGDNFKELYADEWPKHWNERHENILSIKIEGDMFEDLEKMIDLFLSLHPEDRREQNQE